MSKVALYFNPEAFETRSPVLMGRHSAGEGFLRGYLRHTKAEHLYFWNVAREPAQVRERALEPFDLGGRPVTWIDAGDLPALAEPGAIHLPHPRVPEQTWMRRTYSDTLYSVTGVTHTTASSRIMAALISTLTSPVQPWDSIICTSRAVRTHVAAMIDVAAEHLRQHLGARQIAAPRLDTIHLGVDTEAFTPSLDHRRAWREQLDIPEDALVVLYVGRFSLTSKMNPVPMAMAVERLAQETGKPLYWVLSGWGTGPKNTKRFHDYTQAHCPSVHYKVVDGRPPETRYTIWSVGDIFLSLSDNVQETFGLTPVEAMAAGLPCIVSDWNGYKDLVRHGIDGFRISSYTPRAGRGEDIALKYFAMWDNYEAYVGQTAQFTAIDLDETVAALVELAGKPELRKRMGESGRRRAAEMFDWSVIIPQYEALWDELAAIRTRMRHVQTPQKTSLANPWAQDPFRLFANYPSEWLTAHTQIMIAPGVTPDDAFATLKKPMVSAGSPLLPQPAETRAVIHYLAGVRQCRVQEVLTNFPIERRGYVERALVWLAKYGLVKILPRAGDVRD